MDPGFSEEGWQFFGNYLGNVQFVTKAVYGFFEKIKLRKSIKDKNLLLQAPPPGSIPGELTVTV